ncbi:unnamed protein product [Acanthoscelides obtectus]|uniref:Uncharacterized protein n=1 Tax=Acanthoscelides obtectus TaxID=200917 RepID=A0A9P0PXV9_ACAOB|nr:unnamed protein product [Acanthoscelides obtectus]CAK1630555.1 hypothetical protein AOBTE_LOCUS6406 [Acanthoscelides obtectus]
MIKIWREQIERYRDRVRQKTIVNYPESPPPSDHEDPHFDPQILDNRASGANRPSAKQRKRINELIKKQKSEIDRLKNKVKRFQRKLDHVRSLKMSPKSKVDRLLKKKKRNQVIRRTWKKHLSFSKVVQNQLKENINHTKKKNEKTRKVLSCRFVRKYNVLSQIDMKPVKR